MNINDIAILAYLVGVGIVAGVVREVMGGWPDWWPAIAMWPFVPPLAIAAGVACGLIWIGRAPVRLIRRIERARRLPRAEVRR